MLEMKRDSKASKTVQTPIIKTRHQNGLRQVWEALIPTEKVQLWTIITLHFLKHFPSNRSALQGWKVHLATKNESSMIPRPTSKHWWEAYTLISISYELEILTEYSESRGATETICLIQDEQLQIVCTLAAAHVHFLQADRKE